MIFGNTQNRWSEGLGILRKDYLCCGMPSSLLLSLVDEVDWHNENHVQLWINSLSRVQGVLEESPRTSVCSITGKPLAFSAKLRNYSPIVREKKRGVPA